MGNDWLINIRGGLMTPLSILLLLNVCLIPISSDDPVCSLEEQPLKNWKQAIEPGPEDRWLTIPWHTSLHEGLKKAGEEGKPMLLWLMNGHPLGCT